MTSKSRACGTVAAVGAEHRLRFRRRVRARPSARGGDHGGAGHITGPCRRADGSYDAIKLYMRVDPPNKQHIGAALWLLQQAMPQYVPDGRAVLLDVRRVVPYMRLPGRTDFAAWLGTEAASFAYLQTRTATGQGRG